MSYFMRFISTDSTATTLIDIEAALKNLGQLYSIDQDGTLAFGGVPHAQIEINRAGDHLFRDEIEELIEAVNDSWGLRKRPVLATLRGAREIIAAQILWDGRDTDATLKRIAPLWQWLLSARTGLLQADNEGYYNARKRILKVA